MSMKAQVRTDACGNTTIYMEGGLDYESSSQFKRELERIVKKNPTNTIILDLYKLEFVGSSGIGLFANTIKELCSQTSQIKIHNIKNEFLRMFKVYGLDLVECSLMENYPKASREPRTDN